MVAAYQLDSSAGRLPWLLPLALLLSLLSLKGFVILLTSGGSYAPAPKSIELEMVELPPPVAEAPPRQPAPPPVVVEAPPVPALAPAPVEAPPLAAAVKPAVKTPAPSAPETAATSPSMPPPTGAEAAPPTAAPPTVTPEIEEITREGLPGMRTAPLMRSKPLTAGQRKALEEIYLPGRDLRDEEPMHGPMRAAGSKRAAPLTAEQRKALEEIYKPGRDLRDEEAMHGPMRAAGSKRTAPLTKEEWAKLDKIYHVGRGGGVPPPEVEEAPLRGALSIKAGFEPLAPELQPGARVGMRSGMAARAIEQPVPEIPAALRPGSGSVVAVARFHVAADGTAEVELTGPTSEPKLDQMLLEALRKWRFTPAYQAGRAVDSTLELRLTISAP